MEFKKFIDQIDEWMNKDVPFRDTKVKADLINFIKEFIDWESEEVSRELVKLNLNLNKVAIKNQNTRIISDAFILEKSFELQDELKAARSI